MKWLASLKPFCSVYNAQLSVNSRSNQAETSLLGSPKCGAQLRLVSFKLRSPTEICGLIAPLSYIMKSYALCHFDGCQDMQGKGQMLSYSGSNRRRSSKGERSDISMAKPFIVVKEEITR